MASLSDIRAALATRITTGTGLRTLPEARDQISPPVAIILPGQPIVSYGATMDGTFTVNLRVLLAISDAPPNEKVQRALDAYLGIGVSSSSGSSIAGALQQDPTLGGVVHFAEAITAGNYGRISYNDITFFGARVEVQIGAI
jgi:hypothetical protein